jgi:hypothetical protein
VSRTAAVRGASTATFRCGNKTGPDPCRWTHCGWFSPAFDPRHQPFSLTRPARFERATFGFRRLQWVWSESPANPPTSSGPFVASARLVCGGFCGV